MIKRAISILIFAAATAQAAPNGATIEQFISAAKKTAETKPWDYNEKATTDLFHKIDSNGDGIVTGQEKSIYWKAWEKNRQQKKTPTVAAPANNTGGQTIEQFKAQQKEVALTKPWNYDETKTIDLFSKMDKNGDGILTREEKNNYWNNKG